jgi:hypothetical protein
MAIGFNSGSSGLLPIADFQLPIADFYQIGIARLRRATQGSIPGHPVCLMT